MKPGRGLCVQGIFELHFYRQHMTLQKARTGPSIDPLARHCMHVQQTRLDGSDESCEPAQRVMRHFNAFARLQQKYELLVSKKSVNQNSSVAMARTHGAGPLVLRTACWRCIAFYN
jgi:hypothetical protein